MSLTTAKQLPAIKRTPSPLCLIDDIEIDPRILPDRSITPEQFERIRANADGIAALLPKLTDDALSMATNTYFQLKQI